MLAKKIIFIMSLVLISKFSFSYSSLADKVQSTVNSINYLAQSNDRTGEKLNLFIKNEFFPTLDIPTIADSILYGLNINSMTNKEKSIFIFRLKQRILKDLLSKLVNSTGQFQLVNIRNINYSNVKATIKINNYYNYPVILNLLFRIKNNNWKIYDVLLNGDSLVRYYQKVALSKLKRYGFQGMLIRF